MKFTTGGARRTLKALLPTLGLAMLPTMVHAQGLGVASLGATGGLTIPSAYVLDSGGLASPAATSALTTAASNDTPVVAPTGATGAGS